MVQSASLTPCAINLDAMSTGVKHYNCGLDRSKKLARCEGHWSEHWQPGCRSRRWSTRSQNGIRYLDWSIIPIVACSMRPRSK